jgi:hypothetical protein
VSMEAETARKQHERWIEIDQENWGSERGREKDRVITRECSVGAQLQVGENQH